MIFTFFLGLKLLSVRSSLLPSRSFFHLLSQDASSCLIWTLETVKQETASSISLTEQVTLPVQHRFVWLIILVVLEDKQFGHGSWGKSLIVSSYKPWVKTSESGLFWSENKNWVELHDVSNILAEDLETSCDPEGCSLEALGKLHIRSYVFICVLWRWRERQAAGF